VTGAEAPEVAQVATGAGVVLHELAPVQVSLEDAYMQLTATEVEYRSGSPAAVDDRTSPTSRTTRTTGGTR
jgi:ABC-2 type transport system ATP-binding protein